MYTNSFFLCLLSLPLYLLNMNLCHLPRCQRKERVGSLKPILPLLVPTWRRAKVSPGQLPSHVTLLKCPWIWLVRLLQLRNRLDIWFHSLWVCCGFALTVPLFKSSESSKDEQASLLCLISVVHLCPRGRVSMGMQLREKIRGKKKTKTQKAGCWKQVSEY